MYTVRDSGHLVYLGFIALLGSAATPMEKPVTRESCPPPAPFDTLVREIERDTIAGFPAGRVVHAAVTRKRLDHLSPKFGQIYRVGRDVGSMSDFRRVALIQGMAYRLRGWSCNNIAEWLARVPALKTNDTAGIWSSMFAVAAALNPVGDSTYFFARERLPGLSEKQTLRNMPMAGLPLPQLSVDSTGNWRGEITVVWTDGSYHHLRAANWRFRINARGRITFLNENAMEGVISDSSHILVDSVSRIN